MENNMTKDITVGVLGGLGPMAGETRTTWT